MSVTHFNRQCEVDVSALLFDQPCSFYLAGKSGSGKTFFMIEFIKHHQRLGHVKSYTRVFVCFREPQDGLYESIAQYIPRAKIHLIQGTIPSDLYDSLDSNESNLVIIDDLFHEAFTSGEVEKLFTYGRHKNATTFIMSQNLFPPGLEKARTITRNASYIVLFAQRDLNQIRCLAAQHFSKKDKFLETAFLHAIKHHRYLVMDLSTKQAVEEVKFRTNIFDECPIVYLPKNQENNLICE